MFVGIFARSGSKGLPNKNILPFNGGNLLTNAISQGQQFLKTSGFCSSKVFVSSDSETYRSIAKQAGAKADYIRPHSLAADDSPELLSWQHLVNSSKELGSMSTMLVLPVTSPLRIVEDILLAYQLFKTDNYDLVFTGNEAKKNPYLSLFEEGPKNTFYLSKPTGNKLFRRQDLPLVYENNNAVYFISTRYLLSTDYLFSGKIGISIMPHHRSIDIDTRLDYEMAKLILGNKKDSE